jgi:hypothetical protein
VGWGDVNWIGLARDSFQGLVCKFFFPKVTISIECISYRGTQLSTLSHAIVYTVC